MRWGRWKCIFPTNGQPMLFDYEGNFGISEQNDVAGENADVVRAIQEHIEKNGINQRYVTMPTRATK